MSARLRVALACAGNAAQLRAAAVAAQRSGLDRVTVAETGADPFVQLACVADAAPDLELATGVAIAFARTPMTLAYAGWSLQDATAGRAVIGIGSQIQAHIERRFAMPWSAPAARMRDFIEATRAIWTSWQEGTPLKHRGAFYQHTLMNPLFAPGPVTGGPPPIHLAAVGPRMCEVAGAVADGLVTHPFGSADYLRSNTLPIVTAARRSAEAAGAAHTARAFELDAGILVATGRDEAELAVAVAAARERIAFYASTPAYAGVLAHHNRAALAPQLHSMSVRGQWQAMGELIDDELLNAIAVVGEPRAAAGEVLARYGGLADVVTLAGVTPRPAAALLETAASVAAAG